MPAGKRALAQSFADHLNQILNRTVTHGRLRVVTGEDRDTLLIESPRGLALTGTDLFLFMRQKVEVTDKVHTQTYSYRLQTDPDIRATWLIRWEYYRQRPAGFKYPLAHVHVRADPSHRAQPRELPKLHIATGRVAIELVLWHLLSEWDVRPHHENWAELLQESLEGFAQRRSSD